MPMTPEEFAARMAALSGKKAVPVVDPNINATQPGHVQGVGQLINTDQNSPSPMALGNDTTEMDSSPAPAAPAADSTTPPKAPGLMSKLLPLLFRFGLPAAAGAVLGGKSFMGGLGGGLMGLAAGGASAINSQGAAEKLRSEEEQAKNKLSLQDIVNARTLDTNQGINADKIASEKEIARLNAQNAALIASGHDTTSSNNSEITNYVREQQQKEKDAAAAKIAADKNRSAMLIEKSKEDAKKNAFDKFVDYIGGKFSGGDTVPAGAVGTAIDEAGQKWYVDEQKNHLGKAP